MEPIASHETLPQPDLELAPHGNRGEKSQLAFAGVVLLVAIVAVAFWLFDQWSTRPNFSDETSRSPQWLLEASSMNNAQAFVRIQNTSYWSSRTNGLLTSNSHIAAQSAAVLLKSQTSKASLFLAPQSVIHLDHSNVALLGGLALATGPMRVELSSGDRFVRDEESVLIRSGPGAQGMSTEIVPEIEPRVGSTHANRHFKQFSSRILQAVRPRPASTSAIEVRAHGLSASVKATKFSPTPLSMSSTVKCQTSCVAWAVVGFHGEVAVSPPFFESSLLRTKHFKKSSKAIKCGIASSI
jgi:hypothetical protein